MPPRRETAVLDGAPDAIDTAETERTEPLADAPGPVMVIPLGRGKTGKSTFVRWVAETAIGRGGLPVIADADRTNATLAAHFENVLRPASPTDDDVRLWLNDLVDQQIEEKFSLFLDLGGGDLILKTWARELELAAFLEKNGITPVAVHFLGCDKDDLSYLRDTEANTRFTPTRTVVVLNEGLVPPGRVARTAFTPIVEHEVFQKVLARGAVAVRMPRLACMHEVEDRRLSFADAEAGAVKAGQAKIGPVNRQLIGLWRRDMAIAFSKVAQWMP
jgi:hypothetical protein